jgi:flavodoxin I
MSKVIVYYSATGNTEDIANKIKSDLGCDIYNVQDIVVDDILKYDTIIFGCPAMGVEELEENTFRPFFDEFKSKASNKNIALFGSFGWGDGEWMRSWSDEVREAGFNLVCDGLISNGDSSALDSKDYNSFISALK